MAAAVSKQRYAGIPSNYIFILYIRAIKRPKNQFGILAEASTVLMEITIKRPDDWHVHLRDGIMLAAVLPHTARQFARAVIMPNLTPPITTADMAADYRWRILQILPDEVAERGFQPLMTCYLTDETKPADVEQGYLDGVFTAVKLYPANATTNSALGVTDIAGRAMVFEIMQELGMPLLMHGEVTDPDIDIFDREAVFIERVLAPLRLDFPDLKIVLEHATTKDAIDFVRSNRENTAATITAHHLFINRTDIFEGGINPHRYCLPIAKRENHRQALRQAVASGDACFFLGTDTAPHTMGTKETACGCAGIFTAPVALELYAQVFDEEGALDKMEAFTSLNGPAFYGLEPNETTVTLIKESWTAPDRIGIDDGQSVLSFMAGESLDWQLKE